MESRQSQPTWQNRIFVFWTGDNEMEPVRRASLASLAATQCEIILVDKSNLDSWLVPSHPLHPRYNALSAVHRSDYLRAYFMHYHGGGYTDVKPTSDSWRPAFARLLESGNAFGQGYTELRGGVADIRRSQVNGTMYLLGWRSSRAVNNILYWTMKVLHKRLIGNGAFIFKPGTEFTSLWMRTVERRLDILAPHLSEHPAVVARERIGTDYGAGPSRYPVPWSFLMGDVLSPLTLRYHSSIMHDLPPPGFVDYQGASETKLVLA